MALDHCLKCDSKVSWSQCEIETKADRVCTDSAHKRCAAYMEAKEKRDKISYHKRCFDRLENPCHGVRIDQCRVTICDKDLCNFSLTPTATLLASSFRCRQCESNISWSHCDRNSVEVFCGAGYRKCYKEEYKRSDGVMEYAKGCTVPAACGEENLAKMPDAENREYFHCCGQHICNSVVRKSSSIFVIGALLLGCVMLLLVC